MRVHTEGKQEEDEEAKDQPSIIRSEDALATLANLVGGLSSLSAIVDGNVNGLVDGRNGAIGLIDALRDEVILERLVEHGDGDSDRVCHRSEELEPKEDGEGSNQCP